MDHDVVPGCCKSIDWLLNSSWDHFGLHQGKNGSVAMEVSRRHVLRLDQSTGMVQRVLRREEREVVELKKTRAHCREMPFSISLIFFRGYG